MAVFSRMLVHAADAESATDGTGLGSVLGLGVFKAGMAVAPRVVQGIRAKLHAAPSTASTTTPPAVPATVWRDCGCGAGPR